MDDILAFCKENGVELSVMYHAIGCCYELRMRKGLWVTARRFIADDFFIKDFHLYLNSIIADMLKELKEKGD